MTNQEKQDNIQDMMDGIERLLEKYDSYHNHKDANEIDRVIIFKDDAILWVRPCSPQRAKQTGNSHDIFLSTDNQFVEDTNNEMMKAYEDAESDEAYAQKLVDRALSVKDIDYFPENRLINVVHNPTLDKYVFVTRQDDELPRASLIPPKLINRPSITLGEAFQIVQTPHQQ